MPAGIWERYDNEPYLLPPEEALTLGSYVAGPRPEAYLEHLAVGSALAEMPLFLSPDRYINVPLEATYLAAFRGLPGVLALRWCSERTLRQRPETDAPMTQRHQPNHPGNGYPSSWR